jgi:hypothetical protein
MMNIQRSTTEYEAWLAERTTLVPADLHYKHVQMTAGVFPFLRSTFYRWAQLFPEVCPELSKAPEVLAVGDLHIENFGTWRDAEGRLIWGVNDFDEAHEMPYTIDLVRLAVSACLSENVVCDAKMVCETILEGYEAGLKAGGKPFVLAEEHGWLRETAVRDLGNPVQFWKKMSALPKVEGDLPDSAREGLEHLLPRPTPVYSVARRRAGLGSLGHMRFVGLADLYGGQIAREAKAVVPSAWLWAGNLTGPQEILYQFILTRAVRCRDPLVELRGQWILRRLAPDCIRVPLESLSEEKDERRLLRAMGWETANIHLGTPEAIKAVKHDLDKRRSGWLSAAMLAMSEATQKDWQEWKQAPLE